MGKKELWKNISVLETHKNNCTKWKLHFPCRPTKIMNKRKVTSPVCKSC